MPHLKDFTVYTDKLTTGNVIRNDRTIIDNTGSTNLDFTSITNLYDKPPEDKNRTLEGQGIWNKQAILKNPIGTVYTLYELTGFFKDGSINIAYDTFNWKLGTLIVGTIQYGTGKYLGAEGFVEIDITEASRDPCTQVFELTSEIRVTFTN